MCCLVLVRRCRRHNWLHEGGNCPSGGRFRFELQRLVPHLASHLAAAPSQFSPSRERGRTYWYLEGRVGRVQRLDGGDVTSNGASVRGCALCNPIVRAYVVTSFFSQEARFTAREFEDGVRQDGFSGFVLEALPQRVSLRVDGGNAWILDDRLGKQLKEAQALQRVASGARKELNNAARTFPGNAELLS